MAARALRTFGDALISTGAALCCSRPSSPSTDDRRLLQGVRDVGEDRADLLSRRCDRENAHEGNQRHKQSVLEQVLPGFIASERAQPVDDQIHVHPPRVPVTRSPGCAKCDHALCTIARRSGQRATGVPRIRRHARQKPANIATVRQLATPAGRAIRRWARTGCSSRGTFVTTAAKLVWMRRLQNRTRLERPIWI